MSMIFIAIRSFLKPVLATSSRTCAPLQDIVCEMPMRLPTGRFCAAAGSVLARHRDLEPRGGRRGGLGHLGAKRERALGKRAGGVDLHQLLRELLDVLRAPRGEGELGQVIARLAADRIELV